MNPDVRFETGLSDPERDWCISLRQPIASLIAQGALRCFTKRFPPPRKMIGRDIFIHAGGGDVPYNRFDADQRLATELHLQTSLPEARESLSRHVVLAKARLVAGYKFGRVSNGVLYPSVRESDWRLHVGRWEDFRAYDGLFIGEFEKDRWVWWLEDVREIEPQPLKGYAGLFDLELAKQLRDTSDRAGAGQPSEARGTCPSMNKGNV